MTLSRQVWLAPIVHPAAILRGRYGDEPAQIIYLERARDLAAGTWTPEDVTQPPPNTLLEPTLDQITSWLADPATAKGVAVDIETAGDHLVCIGFARSSDEACMVVPFRRPGGDPYWGTRQATEVAVLAVDQLLANPRIPKIFQNGQAFDIPFLTRLGFLVEGYTFDTMLAQRHCYPEMPATLQFIGNLYGRVPNWKWLTKEGQESAK